MAEPLIEKRIQEIASDIRVRGRYRERVLAELRVHLEDATERYEAEGLPHDEAVQTAIDHLGKSEAIGAGLRPQQTSRTWILAALPFAGLAMAGASARVANILHERGDRLWSSPLYTSMWLIGWLSIVLLCGSGAALFVRHRGLLARTGAAAAALLVMSSITLLVFHFANDGSFHRADPDTWRVLAITSGLLAIAALFAMMRRSRLVPLWPLPLAAGGLLLVAVHYLALHTGSLAQVGLGLLIAAAAALTVMLLTQRPIA